jgi:hypothetical protein
MAYGHVKIVGGIVYCIFKKFKKPINECVNYKHSFIIGCLFIVFVFYATLYILYLID